MFKAGISPPDELLDRLFELARAHDAINFARLAFQSGSRVWLARPCLIGFSSWLDTFFELLRARGSIDPDQ